MQRILPTPGAKEFAAPNPPEGALITYAVRATAPATASSTAGAAAAADTGARVVVTDAAGAVVRRFNAPAAPGIHRVAWDLRYDRAPGVTDDDEGWFGVPRGAWVMPGRYTVAVELAELHRDPHR